MLGHRAFSLLAAIWRKVKGSQVQKQLLQLWNIILREANRFFNQKPTPRQKQFQADLTSHGDVEPNPGPLNMRVVCCNVRASTGAWSPLSHRRTASDPHTFLVLCLQETRFGQSEFDAFRRRAHKSGFRVYHVLGRPHEGSHGARLELGGVTILVDCRLQTGPHFSMAGTHSQVIGLWIDDWFVTTFYAPPWENSKQVDPAPKSKLVSFFIHLLSRLGLSTRVDGSLVAMPMRSLMTAFYLHVSSSMVPSSPGSIKEL